jgi:hypothetical protein
MPFKITTALSRTLTASRPTLRNSIPPRQNAFRSLSISAARSVESNPDSKKEALEDREKLNPKADEYSQSGSDDSTAANESASFNKISDPGEAKKEAGKGNEVNPLDASPANPDMSQPTSEVEGGAKKKISEGGGGRQAKDEGKGHESI